MSGNLQELLDRHVVEVAALVYQLHLAGQDDEANALIAGQVERFEDDMTELGVAPDLRDDWLLELAVACSHAAVAERH